MQLLKQQYDISKSEFQSQLLIDNYKIDILVDQTDQKNNSLPKAQPFVNISINANYNTNMCTQTVDTYSPIINNNSCNTLAGYGSIHGNNYNHKRESPYIHSYRNNYNEKLHYNK